MYWRILVIATFLTLAGLPQAAVQAQQSAKVNILAVNSNNFPEIAIDFQLIESNGRKALGVEERQIQILEDGATSINVSSLDSQTADASTPSRRVNLVAPDPNNQSEIDLFTKGAAVGVVFDNTTLINAAARGQRDYLAEGRRAIEQFLLRESKAPSDPEVLSLFLPISSPDQQVQPGEFAAYTPDRNAIINYLRTTAPRNGKTNLFAAIQEAVGDTAQVAREQGRDAVVLVVTDGGDEISGDSFAAIIEQAKATSVKIIAFGIGSDQALINQEGGFRLNQLASATGGVYLQRPDDAKAGEAADTYLTVAADSIYTVRYTTALLDDGKPHSFVLQVQLGDTRVQSQPVSSFIKSDPAVALRPLGPVLLREYFLISVPASLIVSMVIVLAMGGIRWGRSKSISRVQTKH